MFIKRLYKNGQVIIPKKIANKLQINEQTNLSILYENGHIVIDKKNINPDLNQRTLSNGFINIPKEIRDIHGIRTDSYLHVKVDMQSNRILLKPQ